ncbi:MAG: UDP-3-O-(3-hydroxymyristoyl)glucosamine N-acyltransferase, partial [Planctomycetes bacterium]|nr:UDP-3-O-(3-hydroxymyristoyl)glucosamine N-acyltransferase [Planctomycetota bacterium]
MEIALGVLAEQIGATLENGDPMATVHRLAGLAEAGPGDLTFLANPSYGKLLGTSRATAAVVGPGHDDAPMARLVTDNPDLAFAKASALICPPSPRPAPGIHPTAVIGDGVTLGRDVSVGANAVVESGAVVG